MINIDELEAETARIHKEIVAERGSLETERNASSHYHHHQN